MGIASKVRNYVDVFVQGDGVELCEDGDLLRGCSRRVRNPLSDDCQNGSLDYVAFVHLLEHYENTADILKLWFSKLKRNGKLLLVLPHKALYPGPGDPGNPAHRVKFDEKDIIRIMRGTGCEFRVFSKGIIDQDDARSFYVVFERLDDSAPCANPIVKTKPSSTRPINYAIVIPYKGNVRMTEDCVQSIKDAGWKPSQVVLVDDGGDESVPDDSIALSGLRVEHIHNNENVGFPKSVNAGVAAADKSCRVIVLLNNDTIVHVGGEEKLLSPLRQTSLHIVGQQGGKLGDNFEYVGNGSDYVEFYCVAIKRCVWDELGGLDEAFSPGYSEDSDFCLRARKAGYGVSVIGPGICTHKRSQTFKPDDRIKTIIDRNREFLKNKHLAGRALFVVASSQKSGGIKVIWNCALALRERGWQTDALLITDDDTWPDRTEDWEKFDRLFTKANLGRTSTSYDVVVGTYYPTWPVASSVPAKHHVGLAQSDEPRWSTSKPGELDEFAQSCFSTDGFKSIIVADYMYEFEQKYGMHIIGKIDNGVDMRVFSSFNIFERKWPHSMLAIRKGNHVWFDGQDDLNAAAHILSKMYDDFKFVVLGPKSGWKNWVPTCNVERVETYDESKVAQVFNTVSAYVIPSLIEGSSLTALESMACGTPLVCTEIATDAAVDGTNCIHVPYEDPDAIALAVARIFDDDELRMKLHYEGQRTAFNRSLEGQRKQFADIVEGL